MLLVDEDFIFILDGSDETRNSTISIYGFKKSGGLTRLAETFESGLSGWEQGGTTLARDSSTSAKGTGYSGKLTGSNAIDEWGTKKLLGGNYIAARLSFYIRTSDTSKIGPYVEFLAYHSLNTYQTAIIVGMTNSRICLLGKGDYQSPGTPAVANRLSSH